MPPARQQPPRWPQHHCPHQPCPSTSHACPAPQVSGLMAPLSYVMTLSLAVACYNASAEVRGNRALSAARLTCPVARPLPARAPAFCTRPWHCPASLPHSQSAGHCSGPPARQLTHPPDRQTPLLPVHRPATCRCSPSSSWPPTRPSASPPSPCPCCWCSGEIMCIIIGSLSRACINTARGP